MYKYKLQQVFGISHEDATPIKEFGVNLFLNAEGISQHRVMSMLTQFSDEFTALMVTENSDNNTHTYTGKDFSELNKKLMQEGGVW